MEIFNKKSTDEWFAANLSAFIFISSIFILYDDGVASALRLWRGSGAYGHCALILPIAAFLAWTIHRHHPSLHPAPTPWGGAIIAAAGLVWWGGTVAGLAELVHFAIVGVIQGGFVTLWGGRVCRRMLIPLAYLWLMVPTGGALLPLLQTSTATIAAHALDLAQIPSFRDGILIEVASGNYLVEPGCAGLNFLLAALALGLAFVQLAFRSPIRRLSCVALFLLLAVVGNGLRVFLIIAVAHWTNNLGNIADDHLLYGWIGFSLLLLAAMRIGWAAQQPWPIEAPRPAPPPRPPLTWALATAAAIAGAAVLPVTDWVTGPAGSTRPAPWMPVLSCGGLSPRPPAPPVMSGSAAYDGLAEIACDDGIRRYSLRLAVLDRRLRDGKLLGLEARLPGHGGWITLSQDSRVTEGAQPPRPVLVRTQAQGALRRTLWSLYWADGGWRVPGIGTAWADLRADLRGRRHAALLEVSVDDDTPAARTDLQNFLARVDPERLVAGHDQP